MGHDSSAGLPLPVAGAPSALAQACEPPSTQRLVGTDVLHFLSVADNAGLRHASQSAHRETKESRKSTRQIAEAFSNHRFAEVYDRLREDVRWVADDRVAAVDATLRYEHRDGSVSVVSSADICEFDADGRLTTITSYAVELDG